jgi:hypothetical protein
MLLLDLSLHPLARISGEKNLTKPYGRLELFTRTKSRENCNKLLLNTFSRVLRVMLDK